MDSSVALATAYLELNGYFVLTELPVQVAGHQGYRTVTDLDLLAVRLPHAAEIVPSKSAHVLDLLLGQDPLLDDDEWRTEVIIGEVKRGQAGINAGYHDPAVLRFALRRTGCCPAEMLKEHAGVLARSGSIATTTADGHPCRIRVVSFAGQPLALRGVLSIGLAHCIEFIHERIERYEAQLRGAYFRDPVLNLLGLVDSLPASPKIKKESIHAP